MTETLRRVFGRFLGIGIKTMQWQLSGLTRGHRDTQGIMHIGLGQAQKATHQNDSSFEQEEENLVVELDAIDNANIIQEP